MNSGHLYFSRRGDSPIDPIGNEAPVKGGHCLRVGRNRQRRFPGNPDRGGRRVPLRRLFTKVCGNVSIPPGEKRSKGNPVRWAGD